MPDVVVIGGGVIGLSIAYESSRRGLSVVVLEQGRFGKEASWAGAGILPPGHPGPPQSPMTRLAAEATKLWPNWSADLREATGVDNGFRRCGGLSFVEHPGEDVQQEIAGWREAGVDVETPNAEAAGGLEPNVAARTMRRRLPPAGSGASPQPLAPEVVDRRLPSQRR